VSLLQDASSRTMHSTCYCWFDLPARIGTRPRQKDVSGWRTALPGGQAGKIEPAIRYELHLVGV
jgi:hypothetical protein